MKQSLFSVFIILAVQFSAQTITGRIVTDGVTPLSSVLVINMKNNEKTSSNHEGFFSISANVNDELRFIRSGFQRSTATINSYQTSLLINMVPAYHDIEEVEVSFTPTGDLKKDNTKVENKKKVALTNDIAHYIQKKSDASITKPKVGDFVQPVGKGFQTSKIGYKWEILDLINFLKITLGEEYFNTMGLHKTEIEAFINYVLKDFEKTNILRFGNCNSSDVGRFMVAAEQKLKSYKSLKH